MTTASAFEFAAPPARRQSLWRSLRGELKGSEYTWALAFVVPYVGVFLAFVVYPAVYGLWLGSEPSLYPEIFSDPIYQSTVVNTLLFIGIGVNLKMFIALLLSGFFMRPGWWVKVATSVCRSAVASSTRCTAAVSTLTSSTTPPVSTPRTSRSTLRSC